jgi:hypothetical protein
MRSIARDRMMHQVQEPVRYFINFLLISGFRPGINGISTFRECYTVKTGSLLPTFAGAYRFHLRGSISGIRITLEDGTDWCSRNVGDKIPI